MMSLTPQKRYLESVAKILIEPLMKSRGAAWRLLDWDAEQGICVYLTDGADVLLVELEPFSMERPCTERTKRFNVCARRPFEPSSELDAQHRLVVHSFVELVRKREGMLPDIERPTTARRRSVRLIEVERVLVSEGRGHYYINPYVGCTIGCPFCYVAERADMSRAMEGLPAMEWGRWVDVKINAAEVFRRQAKSSAPGLVRMSPILTDPYQPIERRFRVTRSLLESMLGTRYTPALLTRSSLVLRDLDLLERFETALVGFSIPTDDDHVRLAFEPGADSIEQRLDALEKCRKAGCVTLAFIQPVLPMNAGRLVRMLAPLVDAVRIDQMYFGQGFEETYRRGGWDGAMDPAWTQDVMKSLWAGFESEGVIVDEMDDVMGLVRRIRG